LKSIRKNPRREFIKISLSTLAGLTIVLRHVLGGRGFVTPNDKINIGIVGAGGQSLYSINELFKLEDVQLTSIADPAIYWKNDILYNTDTGRGPTKKHIETYYSKKTPNYQISEYNDFRVMLEKERSLDAIVCATPDNTHAYISIFAMRAGRHIYCEKPLTHNIWEARKVRKVARETGMATQMGNQLHSQNNLRQTVEYFQSDVIGTVSEAHSWVSASELSGFPAESTPTPQGFNWDLWLGPISWYEYNKIYTPVKWRDFWAFGYGTLGDFGCHDMDTVTWAFDLHTPNSVEVLPARNMGSAEIAPYGEIGYYNFAAEEKQQPIKLTWYSGGLHPPLHKLLPKNIKLTNRGALFIGDKGIILNNGGGYSAPEIFPGSLENSFSPPAPSIPRSKGHHREWIDAIKGGPAALSNFEHAARLTEITLLGVLSLRLSGEKIYWDTENMKAVGLPEADEIIREPVQKGWEMV